MNTTEKIDTLIETRINGNQIRGNSTYESMLSGIKKNELILHYESIVGLTTFGSKLEIIDQLASRVITGVRHD